MATRASRLNILILMSDQHNKHVLGCYGNEVVRTPNLDRLASEGMRFTNAYCPAPLCVPSRMSFMTGRTPSGNQVWDNGHILSCGIPTWAHVLGAAGYETALIGRMHFVGIDQRHGFEKRPLGEFGARPPGAPAKGGPAWTRYPSEACGQSRQSVEIAGTGTTLYQWFDRQVTRAACVYLREKAEACSDRPFAAVAGFLLPHNPYIAPKDLFEYYYDRVDAPRADEQPPATIRRLLERRGFAAPLSEQRVRIARAAYFALCELFDAFVGEVLACLDETGLAENTLVIYCSDHGDMAGEHGCWCKGNYYEGSVGVPLIARLPGVIAPGAVCDAVCNLMDLGPTLIEAADADPLHQTDGRSLWPTLCGEHPADWPDETYSELVDLARWPRGASPDNWPQLPSRMIRSGKWKLWLYEDEDHLPPALFNLQDDPEEQHDLGEHAAFADVRAELLAKLRSGWDPHRAKSGAIDASKSRRILTAWGRAVRPACPDALAFPPPETEADIQLL